MCKAAEPFPRHLPNTASCCQPLAVTLLHSPPVAGLWKEFHFLSELFLGLQKRTWLKKMAMHKLPCFTFCWYTGPNLSCWAIRSGPLWWKRQVGGDEECRERTDLRECKKSLSSHSLSLLGCPKFWVYFCWCFCLFACVGYLCFGLFVDVAGLVGCWVIWYGDTPLSPFQVLRSLAHHLHATLTLTGGTLQFQFHFTSLQVSQALSSRYFDYDPFVKETRSRNLFQ